MLYYIILYYIILYYIIYIYSIEKKRGPLTWLVIPSSWYPLPKIDPALSPSSSAEGRLWICSIELHTWWTIDRPSTTLGLNVCIAVENPFFLNIGNWSTFLVCSTAKPISMLVTQFTLHYLNMAMAGNGTPLGPLGTWGKKKHGIIIRLSHAGALKVSYLGRSSHWGAG